MNKDRLEEAKILASLSFVRWDRYTEDDVSRNFYGWIDREDAYKDFIVLTHYKSANWWWITSSVRYDLEIVAVMGGTVEKSCPCIRIEKDYVIENSIKLI